MIILLLMFHFKSHLIMIYDSKSKNKMVHNHTGHWLTGDSLDTM